jgi:hypothetical protein
MEKSGVLMSIPSTGILCMVHWGLVQCVGFGVVAEADGRICAVDIFMGEIYRHNDSRVLMRSICFSDVPRRNTSEKKKDLSDRRGGCTSASFGLFVCPRIGVPSASSSCVALGCQ